MILWTKLILHLLIGNYKVIKKSDHNSYLRDKYFVTKFPEFILFYDGK